jgi:hypothetical protein
MAYCSNCGDKLVLSSDVALSTDKLDVTHYTHFCSTCKLYWHLHISGIGVVLSASDTANVGMDLSKQLLKDLKAKVAELEAK